MVNYQIKVNGKVKAVIEELEGNEWLIELRCIDSDCSDVSFRLLNTEENREALRKLLKLLEYLALEVEHEEDI